MKKAIRKGISLNQKTNASSAAQRGASRREKNSSPLKSEDPRPKRRRACPTPAAENFNQILESLHERSSRSPFLERIEQCRNAGNGWLFGGLLRPLTQEEIRNLQEQGNRCRDWNRIRVCLDFTAQWIWNSVFEGYCLLGVFTGVDTPLLPGTALPTGIVRSTIMNSEIGNECLIHDAGLVSNQLIYDSAVLYRIHVLSCGSPSGFGNGETMAPGAANGLRLPVFTDITADLAKALSRSCPDAVERSGYEDWLNRYRKACTLDFGVVESGARIITSGMITNTFIGASARIEGAARLSDVTIASTKEKPVTIGHCSIIRNACLQGGVRVGDMASAEKAVLLEGSCLEPRSSVTNGIIGPRASICGSSVVPSPTGPDTEWHGRTQGAAASRPKGGSPGSAGSGAHPRKRKGGVQKSRQSSKGPKSRRVSR